jgi:DNA-binding protein HU-beta
VNLILAAKSREPIDPQGGVVNKSEMADKLATKADISKAQAAEIIDHIFSTKDGEGIIAVELDEGGKVNVTGFGSFAVKRRSERQGRNPATGETITIPARNYAHFSASKGLKDRVAR